jgi:hypothetical protein
MNESRTVAFSGIEKQIRDAGLTQSAMIGEAIGDALAAAWFGAKRLTATKYAALTHRLAAYQRLNLQRRVATHH